jgi:5-oxoprolinase (ATP-hydrolysing) subunit A
MSRILLNADIGERGPDHPVDRELMRYLDIANIACGGHAGNAESVAAFAFVAAKRGIMVAAHLSYPDKEHFGREPLHLPFGQLRDSLDTQLALIPDARAVKFHGALYSDSCADRTLAEKLAEWLHAQALALVITLKDSELSRSCERAGIRVLAEAFAERRYAWSSATGRLSLVRRTRPDACMTDLAEALEQVRTIIAHRQVRAMVEGDGVPSAAGLLAAAIDTQQLHSDSAIALGLARRTVAREDAPPTTRMIEIAVDTLCIHSDSPIALKLAQRTAELLHCGGE